MIKIEKYHRLTYSYLHGEYLAGDQHISNEINKLIQEFFDVTPFSSLRIVNVTVTEIGRAIFHQVHLAYTPIP